MAAKPTSKPNWTYSNPDLPIVTVEPDGSQKITGWQAGQKPPFQWMNWLFYNLSQWVDYVDDPDTRSVRVNDIVGNSQTVPLTEDQSGQTFAFSCEDEPIFFTLPPVAPGLFFVFHCNTIHTTVDGKAPSVTPDGSEDIDYQPKIFLSGQYGSTWIIRSNEEGTRWAVEISIAPDSFKTVPAYLRTTSIAGPEANPWASVAAYDGIAVAVAPTGTNRIAVRNRNGVWSAVAAPAANSWQSVAHMGANGFVAVSSDGTNRVMKSNSAGGSWAVVTGVPSQAWVFVKQVAEGFNPLILAGSSGGHVMASTDNGATWTLKTSIPGAPSVTGFAQQPRTGRIVATTSNGAYYSDDVGATWTACTLSGVFFTNIAGVDWSEKYGVFLLARALSEPGVTTRASFDGATFDQTGPDLAGGAHGKGIVFSKILGEFVMYNSSGSILVSRNSIDRGTYYTTPEVGGALFVSTFDDQLGIFVAVAASGTNRIMTSR